MKILDKSSQHPRSTTGSSHMKTNEWLSISYFHIVLLVFGIFSICAITLILLATAVAHTGWWNRRRRIWQRRTETIGKSSKLLVADQMRNLLMNTVDTLAIATPDEDRPTVKQPRPGTIKYPEKGGEQPSLPLRFQPEKLYGATTTIHRENLRKGSCANLGLPSPGALGRRRSMFEGIMFPEVSKTVEQHAESVSRSNNSLSIPEVGSTSTNPHTSQDLKPSPMTTRRLSIGSFVQSRQDEGSLSDSKGDKTLNFLNIPLVTRRASSTDYELLDARMTKGAEKFRSPIEITITDAYSDVDGPSAQISRKSSYSSKQSESMPENMKSIRRNSFLSYYLLPAQHDQTDSDDDADKGDVENMKINVSHIPAHCTTTSTIDLNEKSKLDLFSSIRSKSRRRGSVSIMSKLPTLTTHEIGECPAGSLAAELRFKYDPGSPVFTIIMSLIAGKNLPSPRLWHKSTFSVKCTFGSSDTSQTITCKEAELGCPRFQDKSEVSFESIVCRGSDRLKADINLKVYEHISKWSGEKDFYHGSVNIHLDEPIREEERSDRIAWYPIEPAYPIIRVRGDLLVSLCRRQLKGVVSVGIHEIRNMEFVSYGKWKIDNINLILRSRPLDLDVHACLVYGERIVKANKLVSLHQPLTKVGEVSQDNRPQSSLQSTKQSNKPKQLSPFAKLSLLTNGDYFTQFALPTFKKAFGKHLVSNHGIILLIATKLSIGDVIPRECLQELKHAGVSDFKTMYGVGECSFGDPGFQGELKADSSVAERNNNQGALFWNEAGSRGSNRVYQWLTMK